MGKLDGVTILFDLDGTLVETAPDIIAVLNVMLGARNYPAVPMSAARHLVGHGALALLRRGFADAGAVWNEDDAPALLDQFLTLYLDRIAEESHPFEGVEAAMEALAAEGAILAVATNKPTYLSVALIEQLGLTHHFAAIVGPDKVSAMKPAADHLIEAARMAGGDPARCIMVGDSATDVGAAKNARMPCFVVSFGYTEIAPRDLGGHTLIDAYAELPGVVDRIVGEMVDATGIEPVTPSV